MPDQPQADQRQAEGGVTPARQRTSMRIFFAVGLVAGCLTAMNAYAQAPKLPANLPAALRPAGIAPYLQVSATGAQVYTCSMSNGAWAWVFRAPDAQLFDAQKKQVG